MLECTGRFLGLDSDSYVHKATGELRTNYSIEVKTKKGTETLRFSPMAYEMLKGKLSELVPYVDDIIVGVEISIGSEYVQFEKVARPELQVIDLAKLPTKAPAAAASNGAK